MGIMFLIVFGMVLALAALTWVAVWWDRSSEGKERYDERQQLMQGKAYRFSSYVGFVYFAGLMIYLVYISGYEKPAPWLLVGAGIMVTWMSYHFYCLLTQAALPLGEKPWVMALNYIFLAVIQGLYYWEKVRLRDMTDHWDENMAWLHLMGLVCFGMLALCYLLAGLWKDRE